VRLGPKRITRDMITAAHEKGWNVTQTARHYGMHRTSISAACERFGIELSQSKFSPDLPSTRSRFWKEVDAAPTPVKAAVWSCKPGAIERALARLEAQKALQLKS
jgi:hypothetical protein